MAAKSPGSWSPPGLGRDGITAVLGIGINVTVSTADLPPGATSLSAAVGAQCLARRASPGSAHAAKHRLHGLHQRRWQTGSERMDQTGGAHRRTGPCGRRAERHSGEMLGIDATARFGCRDDDGGRIVEIVAGRPNKRPSTEIARRLNPPSTSSNNLRPIGDFRQFSPIARLVPSAETGIYSAGSGPNHPGVRAELMQRRTVRSISAKGSTTR